jgi:HPt (histidine-containing phosphotransfer) domain-containing protein
MKTDLTYLREMSGGNLDLVREMITIFIGQVGEFSEEMDRHLVKKEYELLGKLAHKAKSSISIMGLNDLARDLKNLEIMAKEGREPAKYPGMVSRFKEETRMAVDELNEVLKNLDTYL